MLCLGVVTVPRSNQPPSAPPAANSVRATLDGWRAEVIAEVEAENANDDSATNDCAIVRVPVNTAPPHDGFDKLCSAPVHGITNPVNYARNQARQQQAEEAERGQHREKQLAGAAGFLKVREGRPTTYEDVKHYLRRMSRSAGGESELPSILADFEQERGMALSGRRAGMGSRTVSSGLCRAGHPNL